MGGGTYFLAIFAIFSRLAAAILYPESLQPWARVEHKFAQKSHVDETSGSSKMKVYRPQGCRGWPPAKQTKRSTNFSIWDAFVT